MNYSQYLKKNGFVLIKNFFDQQDIEEIKNISERLHSTNIKSVPNLHNFDFSWKLITNSKIINFLKKFYSPNEVYYLYNSHSVKQKDSETVDPNWHRDNSHRTFGKGEDWSGNYNVLRVGIYLNEDKKNKNGLKLIKKSHKSKKIICFLLRHLRLKFKKIYFNRIFRFFLDKIIGVTVKPNIGDCLFFYANTYHAALRNKNVSFRKALFLTYGTRNIHSENFLNYYLFHHKLDHSFDNKKNNFDIFLKFLKTHDINSYLPNNKKIDKNLSL